jgi:2-oxoglutarate ferredoxin oxidoreductase subunit alpha
VPAYDWDENTGLSQRPIPGQVDGMYVLTGLSHTERSKVSYNSETNQITSQHRSRKLAALQSTLKPPIIHAVESQEEEGDLLVVSWGSTIGAIEEAVETLRQDGHKVACVHLRFLSPLEPGLKAIFSRYKKVMTVEINYSDEIGDPMITVENRRYAQLANILRAQFAIDIDCWSVVYGHPLQPGLVIEELSKRLDTINV